MLKTIFRTLTTSIKTQAQFERKMGIPLIWGFQGKCDGSHPAGRTRKDLVRPRMGLS